ncbi:hypothetical protein CTEN210_13435 [Chaetoceros tenuissimus]|uniref:Leucine-rich repeat domain-containing protein n=1 Tax=Chaetoceros tenuissimus TaxID=426638 RepID=A0AAD3HBE7_9STRA|nr:hypothetical protein CTEN210_13435 [Chaetoceros tenuissimus]
MFRGKKTFFYNGEKLWDQGEDEDPEVEGWPRVHDYEERESWQVLVVLPGVTVIPNRTFYECRNIETVIMSDTVRRIEWSAFHCCFSLKFVRLSRSLEFIGHYAFYACRSLVSIFIPPLCRDIGDYALCECEKLIILGIPQNVQLGEKVIAATSLIKKSPIENRHGYYDRNNENEVVRWVKSINNEEVYALHRACASFNPLSEIIHELVKRQGIKAMKITNSIGVTPSQYLEANTFADISEKEIINRYISDMMGEVI